MYYIIYYINSLFTFKSNDEGTVSNMFCFEHEATETSSTGLRHCFQWSVPKTENMPGSDFLKCRKSQPFMK